ncbi:MAG: YcjF family protein, partial [Burkholderiaceae bacterium]
SDAELDKTILNYSTLNGALELLPQSMASMAIIPLQMKMVYRIGKAHGYELDRGHIKDLLATMGVGLTGQYLEDIGRKVIGGLLGKVAGRMAGGLARGATGAAFSFATTYALGQVAKRYYAGGRTMSTQMLKDVYASTLTQAKGLQVQYAPQIEQQARTVDVGRIVQMVRAS